MSSVSAKNAARTITSKGPIYTYNVLFEYLKPVSLKGVIYTGEVNVSNEVSNFERDQLLRATLASKRKDSDIVMIKLISLSLISIKKPLS